MLEQRSREAVVKNHTISVLEAFSLRPLSEANLLTILLCSVAPWVEVAIVLTSSAWAAPQRYRLQIDTPALSCFREWSNLSIMTRDNVGESIEPCCTPCNMGKTAEEVKLTLTMACRFP